MIERSEGFSRFGTAPPTRMPRSNLPVRRLTSGVFQCIGNGGAARRVPATRAWARASRSAWRETVMLRRTTMSFPDSPPGATGSRPVPGHIPAHGLPPAAAAMPWHWPGWWHRIASARTFVCRPQENQGS